jgi:DNA polymerase I-like protein with 3'-5' exonuclease and polymerase domains
MKKIKQPPPTIIIVDNKHQAETLARVAMLQPWVNVDSETEGFDRLRQKMCMLQIAFIPQDNLVIYLVDLSKVSIQIFKPLLESPDVLKIIHGSFFDCTWLAHEHKIFVQFIYDTMQQEKIMLGVVLPKQPPTGKNKAWLESMKPDYSAALEWCLSRRGLPAKMEFEEFVYGKKWTPKQITYSARDVEFLHIIREDQEQQISLLNMDNVLILENGAAEIFYKMASRGFCIDVKGWNDYATEIEAIYNKAIAGLTKFGPTVNWQAPGQTCKFFGVTKIAELAELDPLTLAKDKQKAYKLWESARATKTIVKTFGKDWIIKNTFNGKVYCDFTQIVNTGRCSSDRPNLQNIPVKKTVLFPEGFRNREFFVPTKGRVFFTFDFSGQELAIMAIGSGEPVWLFTLRSGGDLHGKCGELMTKAAGKEIVRRQAKTLNFTMGYGGGKATVVVKLKQDYDIIISEDEAQELINIYFRTFPRLKSYLDGNGKSAVRSGETFSYPPFNRRRVLALEDEDWRKKNIGKNSPIQGTAADMTKLAMIYMEEAFNEHPEYGAVLIHQLHDELIAEGLPKYKKQILALGKDCMNRACIAILGEAISAPDASIMFNWNKNNKE